MKYIFNVDFPIIAKQRQVSKEMRNRGITPAVIREQRYSKIRYAFISIAGEVKPHASKANLKISVPELTIVNQDGSEFYRYAGDLDSIAASIMDALAGYAYNDDSQIYKLEIERIKVKQNFVIVELEFVDECPVNWKGFR